MDLFALIIFVSLIPFTIGYIVVKATERDKKQAENPNAKGFYFDRLLTLVSAYIFSCLGIGQLVIFLAVALNTDRIFSYDTLLPLGTLLSLILHLFICAFWIGNVKLHKSIIYTYLAISNFCIFSPLLAGVPLTSDAIGGWIAMLLLLFTVIALGYYASIFHLKNHQI